MLGRLSQQTSRFRNESFRIRNSSRFLRRNTVFAMDKAGCGGTTSSYGLRHGTSDFLLLDIDFLKKELPI